MANQKTVRYFAYIDEQTINSFYNQMDNAYDLERKSVTKDKSVTGETQITLKNIILGILDAEGRIQTRFTRTSNEEIERGIKIETKFIELLKIAKGDEKLKLNVKEFSGNKQLICGTVCVIECDAFLESVSNVYNKKINSYEEFLSIRDDDKDIAWNDITANLTFDHLLGNGLSFGTIMQNWYEQKEEMFSFVVIDNICPIIMDMSYKKITMPHSQLRSSGLFCRSTEFSVLGIITKTNGNLYLKSLALWNIIDIETAHDCVGCGLEDWETSIKEYRSQ